MKLTKQLSFGATPPYDFIVRRKRFLPLSPLLAESSSVLSEQEVLVCADILAFARTHFESKSD